MNEYYDYIKNHIINSIVSISIFNCKTTNITDEKLLEKIDDLSDYILKKWSDKNV